MAIASQISTVRSQSEEIFYALSASMNKEEAEKLTPDILRICIEKQIAVHEISINLCNKAIEHMGKPAWVRMKYNMTRQYVKGVVDANTIRKQSHEDSIAELNDQIQLLKLI